MDESIDLVNNFKAENIIFNNDKFNELEEELIKKLNIENNKLYYINDNIHDNYNVIYFNFAGYKILLKRVQTKIFPFFQFDIIHLICYNRQCVQKKGIV